MPFTQNYIIAPSNNPNDFKLIAYEATTPNIAVEEHIINAPHTTQQTASFVTLNYVAHRFRLYEWNGTTLGSMLHDVLVQPTEDTIYTPPDIELVVGVDLVAGNTQWDGLVNYPQYSGYNLGTDFRVIQRSVSNLKSVEVQQYGAFGCELLGGQVFSDGDTYFIEFLPRLVVNPANYNSGNNIVNGVINGYVDESSSFAISNIHYNKIINIVGGSGWIDCLINNITLIPDFTKLIFCIDDTFKTGVKIIGDFYAINGYSITEFYLRRGETAEFIKINNKLKLVGGYGNYNRVGEQVVVEGYQNTDADFRTIKEWGQWVNIIDEPRFFYWFVARLPLNYLAASATTELHKYYIDNVNNKFRMPETINIQVNAKKWSIPPFLTKPGDEYIIQVNNNTPTNVNFGYVSNHYNRIL